MPHLKKLVIKGFKSFARETTIDFSRNMNLIVGPNGSGKSNITDALCFVLGRLSIKSMRAAKASHLIFAGNKDFKGANEAFVEMVIDNEDKTFAVNENEIKIRRIVRKNGQSIYKINNETKTRQEVLELLSQGGIDPRGFNIVLQGEIERFVKMPAEDRRKIIEEVAGISVYEMRKEKSIRELEKTEEKLKQIGAVLRERTKYLQNLETEREEALKFKKLELTIKQCKASIINKNLQEKQRELEQIEKQIDSRRQDIQKKQNIIDKTQKEINVLNEKIENITKTIQKSSGLEQDALLNEISQLKQEIAGTTARKENYENQLNELERRENALKDSITTAEDEIKEMTQEKGKNKKKDLEDKKTKLEELDDSKRKSYLLKSTISSLTNQIEDKKRQIQRFKNESNFIINQIEPLELEIKIKHSLEQHSEAIVRLRDSLKENKIKVEKLESELIEKEKRIAVNQDEIKGAEKVKSKISKLDICPLCRTKMTPEHIIEVTLKADKKIEKCNKTIEDCLKHLEVMHKQIKEIKETISEQTSEINTREVDIIKITNINDKKQQLHRNSVQIKLSESELDVFERNKKETENKFSKINLSEENYESLKLEVNELARSEERNLGIEITTKQRELERIKLAIKQILRDKESIRDNAIGMKEDLEEKEKLAEEKEEQAEILKRKYQKMFEEKNTMQDKIRMFETSVLNQQNEKRFFESEINNFSISKAGISAKRDNFLEELKEFSNIEFIALPLDKLKEKLDNSLDTLTRIGSVNLRALEVYDNIKEEYEKIKLKVEQLEKEKLEILNIIAQIDRKKKKTFLETLTEINQLFSRNFSQLSTKGVVVLEPQDKSEIFNAGLDIIVKTGIGKYFDVTSLSGGEQTLVALALIFAIQEHKPYCFYIFDEIDAALDKRNSEKLAYLLKKYMKEGQYIIVTHNDALISESTNVLYGVSMQDGISKILSLQL